MAGSFMGRAPLLFFLLGGGFLAVVNRRFGTPHWLLSFIFAVSAVSLVLAGNRVETFAIFASLGGIIIFVPVMRAALRLPRSHPEVIARSALPLRGAMAVVAPVGGLVLCLLTVDVLLVDLSTRENGWFFLGVFVLWVVGGATYAALRLGRRRAQFMSRTSG
jgi:APA family basic amino acid/polyamine antiporter